MIAVDTNILVYAHRADSEWHATARAAIATLAEGRVRWAIPWPCVHEFLAVVTHPRLYTHPSTLAQALDQVEAWMESPVVEFIGESRQHWPALRDVLSAGRVRGPKVHDARVAAICLEQGVTELLSADRDFNRFAQLTTRNPLLT